MFPMRLSCDGKNVNGNQAERNISYCNNSSVVDAHLSKSSSEVSRKEASVVIAALFTSMMTSLGITFKCFRVASASARSTQMQ